MIMISKNTLHHFTGYRRDCFLARYISPSKKKAAIRQYIAHIRFILSTPTAGIIRRVMPLKNWPKPSTIEIIAVIPF